MRRSDRLRVRMGLVGWSVTLIGSTVALIGSTVALIGVTVALIGSTVAFLGQALTLVSELFALVGDMIALVGFGLALVSVEIALVGFGLALAGDAVAFVGEPVAFVGESFALLGIEGPQFDESPVGIGGKMTKLGLATPVGAVSGGTIATVGDVNGFPGTARAVLSGVCALTGRTCAQLRGEGPLLSCSRAQAFSYLLRLDHFGGLR